MRSSDEVPTVSSSLLNVGSVPLEQVPALAVTVDAMVQRILPGSNLVLPQRAGFSSHI